MHSWMVIELVSGGWVEYRCYSEADANELARDIRDQDPYAKVAVAYGEYTGGSIRPQDDDWTHYRNLRQTLRRNRK